MEQREIKFRAWDTHNERMVIEPYRFVPMAEYQKNNYGWVGSHVFYEDWTDIEDGIERPCFIMQFTGLKDKNGVEIYEGDILRVFETIDFDPSDKHIRCFEVEWGGKYPAFTLKGYEDLEYNSLQHATLVESCEVIGNIYEHPHLVAGSKDVTNQ